MVGVGLKRLDDTGRVGVMTRATRHIRNTAKAALATFANIEEFSALPRELQTSATVKACVLKAAHAMASPRRQKQLEARIEPAPRVSQKEAFRLLAPHL